MVKSIVNIKRRHRTRRHKRLTRHRKYFGGDPTSEQPTHEPNGDQVPSINAEVNVENNRQSEPEPVDEVETNRQSEPEPSSLVDDVETYRQSEPEVKQPEPNPTTTNTPSDNNESSNNENIVMTQREVPTKENIADQISLADSQVKTISDLNKLGDAKGSNNYIDTYGVERTYNPETDTLYEIINWVEIPEDTIKFTSDVLKEPAMNVVSSIKEYLEKLSDLIGTQNKYIKVVYGGSGEENVHIVHTSNPIFVLRNTKTKDMEMTTN
jgi:hypothetical protein